MMSEQQFTIESERINTTYAVRILKDDEVIFEISNWNSLGEMHKTECEDIVNVLNKQQDIIEKLQQKIDAYERLITNSYEGKEETLDGYDGMYVIWESELKEWRKKYE